MSGLSGFDLVILVVVTVVGIWLFRFVRRALAARCGCENTAKCSGCGSRPLCEDDADK
jgi:hypothetical protein